MTLRSLVRKFQYFSWSYFCYSNESNFVYFSCENTPYKPKLGFIRIIWRLLKPWQVIVNEQNETCIPKYGRHNLVRWLLGRSGRDWPTAVHLPDYRFNIGMLWWIYLSSIITYRCETAILSHRNTSRNHQHVIFGLLWANTAPISKTDFSQTNADWNWSRHILYISCRSQQSPATPLYGLPKEFCRFFWCFPLSPLLLGDHSIRYHRPRLNSICLESKYHLLRHAVNRVFSHQNGHQIDCFQNYKSSATATCKLLIRLILWQVSFEGLYSLTIKWIIY